MRYAIIRAETLVARGLLLKPSLLLGPSKSQAAHEYKVACALYNKAVARRERALATLNAVKGLPEGQVPVANDDFSFGGP